MKNCIIFSMAFNCRIVAPCDYDRGSYESCCGPRIMTNIFVHYSIAFVAVCRSRSFVRSFSHIYLLFECKTY